MTDMEACDIAIIGLEGRFPSAANVDEFWDMLKNGREGLIEFSDESLLAAGVDPLLLKNPNYVKVGSSIPNIESFDANFFGMNDMDAKITDPQQRLFMECVWQTLEQAGYPPATTDAKIGLYAGVSDNSYAKHCLEPNMDALLPVVGGFRLYTVSGKDFFATRTAYTLNLTGPAMTVQTACSTSLVAVHVACQSLLNMECDMALAGGASISVPQHQGYMYQEGMIMSPDGHCRTFDAQAQGTAAGAGVGVVLLKRADEALEDGDTIYAIIKGSAINNDGSDKVGYTAPSINGQRDVISEAHDVANVHPDDISYIEAHGTATPLGDPIEIQALCEAFRAKTQRTEYCAIGSVKSNIGHADTAAGVIGLIKTVLALKHRQLPPSLHFNQANSEIDFANSPFFVNDRLRDWQTDNGVSRRAGVSSFGIGGTNAHVIVEQAPSPESGSSSRVLQLIHLSAKTSGALEKATENLLDWLKNNQEENLPDIAYTLNKCRQSFEYRRSLVCSDVNNGLQQLANPAALGANNTPSKAPSIVFLFPGQGSQYFNMSKSIYAHERVFKNTFDECAKQLSPYLETDLRDLLYSDDTSHQDMLKQTVYTQPVLFAVEYSLATLWMSWGIKPTAMLGHSIGEYVAACLAGVLSLHDALALVAARAKLIQSLPSGAMLAVPLSESDIHPWISAEISLAVVNSPKRCVVSGTHQAIASLQESLRAKGVECRALHTSHAFHSHLLEPVLDAFRQKVNQVTLHPPKIPYLSNFSGDWIRPQQAIDVDYWVSHLRHTVRFSDNVQALFKHQTDILLEVGPGQTLSALIRQHPERSEQCALLPSLPPQRNTDDQSELKQVLATLGKLWCHGANIDWKAFYAEEKRRRLPMPTYPFERRRYWIEPPRLAAIHTLASAKKNLPHSDESNADAKQWLYRPHWNQSVLEAATDSTPQHWLIFEDYCGVTQQVRQALLQQGHKVTCVQYATIFEKKAINAYTINPQRAEDFESLIHALEKAEFPNKCLHCWTINGEPSGNPFEQSELALKLGFYSLLNLTKALGKCNITQSLDITTLSNHMQAVMDADQVRPEQATLLGAIKTIAQEADNLHYRSIDITLPVEKDQQLQLLLRELSTPISDPAIAYRQKQRWVQSYEAVLWNPPLPMQRIRQQGTYLITGGLGGIGLTLAEYLAHHAQAKLILIGRSLFPAKKDWQNYVSSHQDAISQQIHLLQQLEKVGAEVLVCSANVADIQQMQAVIEAGQQQFGEIHGVIHAAGIPDGAFIANRDQQTSAQVFESKVTGTLVLNQLFSDTPLDFFVLCSSLASIIGTPGQVAYCAANAFQDAFAQARRLHPKTLFTAINWDTWQKVGMAVKAVNNPLFVNKPVTVIEENDETANDNQSERERSHGLLPEEGICVFEQVLQHQHAQVLVVKEGLSALFEEQRNVFATEFINEEALESVEKCRPLSAPLYIAPRTELERKLAEVWQKFLGISPIGIEDDFFEFGGDSLLAVQLSVYVRSHLQVELSTQALLNAPTIAHLAELLKDRDAQAVKTSSDLDLLVELKSGNSQHPPLIMIHPVGGYVFFYRELAQQLSDDQAVYGIQAQGVDGNSLPLDQVEAMASQYIVALQKHQPIGPYLLGGSSFGGMIAYEMAQQLKRLGEDVALLALIDTPGPGYMPTGDIDDDADIMSYILEVGNNIIISPDELRQMDSKTRWAWFIDKTAGGDSEISELQSRIFIDLFRANIKAMFAYQPQPWDGKAVFFSAQEKDGYNPSTPEEAWIPLVRDSLTIWPIPGNHITMNAHPHVMILADYLQQEIVKALD